MGPARRRGPWWSAENPAGLLFSQRVERVSRLRLGGDGAGWGVVLALPFVGVFDVHRYPTRILAAGEDADDATGDGRLGGDVDGNASEHVTVSLARRDSPRGSGGVGENAEDHLRDKVGRGRGSWSEYRLG